MSITIQNDTSETDGPRDYVHCFNCATRATAPSPIGPQRLLIVCSHCGRSNFLRVLLDSETNPDWW